ncbi:alkaline shock response membrane anchor protein AmaP [Streptomyces sp. NPDC013455]|uniref:alkaline shock response membrane anchor protein AmaP n=1 Tax=Streptomyces sp. NPDC013455 TaxID=3155605 RepID=UPI0033CAE791
MRTGLQRFLLALTGLLLLVLGGAVLAVGLGVRPPSWWLHTGPHDVLLTRAERTRWRDAGWWWPAVIAALALLVLLALWWLTAALRRRRPAEIPVDTGDGAGARLRGRALESALTAETAAQPGVADARVRLAGRRTAPKVRARIRLEPSAAPEEVLAAFTAGTLTHARESAGLASLPAEVRLTEVGHAARRVT